MASARTRYFAKKLFEISGFLPVGAFLLEHFYSNFQAVGPGGEARFNEVVVAGPDRDCVVGNYSADPKRGHRHRFFPLQGA